MESKRSSDVGTEIHNLLDSIYETEQLISTARAQKSSMTRERVEIQDELDALIIRFQALTALVNAEGRPIQVRSEELISDLSDTVSDATKALRRGDEIDSFRRLVEVAKTKFEDTERIINCIIIQHQKMTQLTTNAHRKISSLSETLMMAQGKAATFGIKHIKDVHESLSTAVTALDNA